MPTRSPQAPGADLLAHLARCSAGTNAALAFGMALYCGMRPTLAAAQAALVGGGSLLAALIYGRISGRPEGFVVACLGALVPFRQVLGDDEPSPVGTSYRVIVLLLMAALIGVGARVGLLKFSYRPRSPAGQRGSPRS